MKQLITQRSSTIFLVSAFVLIAITSFLHGFTDERIGLLSPILTIATAGITAMLFEIFMQRRAQ